jgi:hypothetical protein
MSPSLLLAGLVRGLREAVLVGEYLQRAHPFRFHPGCAFAFGELPEAFVPVAAADAVQGQADGDGLAFGVPKPRHPRRADHLLGVADHVVLGGLRDQP